MFTADCDPESAGTAAAVRSAAVGCSAIRQTASNCGAAAVDPIAAGNPDSSERIVLPPWILWTTKAASAEGDIPDTGNQSMRLRWAALILLCLCTVVRAQQILPRADLQRIADHLPELADEEWDETLHNPDVIWYDNRIGVLHQVAIGGGEAGFVNSEFIGNDANSRFPWTQLKPGGFHRSGNVNNVKGLLLPRADNGAFWPAVYGRSPIEGLNIPGQTLLGWDMIFPVGTVWIEVIFVDFDQQHHACEVRFRIREETEYGVDVFRPFPSAEKLSMAIGLFRPDWEDDPTLSTLVSHLDDPNTAQRHELKNAFLGSNIFGTKSFQAFRVQAMVDELPPVGDNRLVQELLDGTKFESVLGETPWGATTSADAHVIPQNADTAFLGLDRESCAKCHVDALASGRRWGQQIRTASGATGSISLSGWIRGWTEGVLSFQPTINHFQRDGLPRRPVFRQQWIEQGVIARYNANIHPISMYRKIQGPLNRGRDLE